MGLREYSCASIVLFNTIVLFSRIKLFPWNLCSRSLKNSSIVWKLETRSSKLGSQTWKIETRKSNLETQFPKTLRNENRVSSWDCQLTFEWYCMQINLEMLKSNSVDQYIKWVINASAAVTLLEHRPEKILRLWAGLEPTTSAMPVQCSSNWAIKATWERSYMG